MGHIRYEIKEGKCFPVHVDTEDMPVEELREFLAQQGMDRHNIEIGVCLDLPGD